MDKTLIGSIALAMVIFAAHGVAAGQKSIIVQSTTSTKNSGLYSHLLPKFKAATGITAHVVAVGTGQAIRNARNCDGDVLLVHAKAAEDAFVAGGFGVKRFELMYNDFVIVGPPTDPAAIAGRRNAVSALKRIAAARALFVSRGDDSGTHKAEQALWRSSGIDQAAHSGQWYRETGSGMGATLNIAVAIGAYTLTDRATWIAFKNKADFKIAVEGDPALYNQYGVVRVSDVKCPQAKSALAQKFIDWLLSRDGQAAIADYRIAGQQLFFPNGPARNRSTERTPEGSDGHAVGEQTLKVR